ncbi:MAG: DUF4250 domain-containing protein [Lachnospiraceae bacterium]|nr:DUF4250 domain-containing protein [Lachnospiraceae bacterium]MDY5741391.1 DUF4250 domain-containing protein [Lachnospiraceae bacterium]
MLPKDPVMLLSVINTRLRDSYSSFDLMCQEEDISEQEAELIVRKLAGIGYDYDRELNKFV